MVTAQSLAPDKLLANLPPTLRSELINAYDQILRNYRERRWEPSELNGGKLCEVIHTILSGHVAGAFPARATKPRNMVDACKALEGSPPAFPRSIRVQIPRMVVALYEVRNNRGAGHVGGDVDPNHMDAACVLGMSKWLMSELIRVFHNVTTEDATAAVDSLIDRTLPEVWKVGENLRVLKPDMSMKDKTLVLLYHRYTPVPEIDLFRWVEHSNASTFRRDVLRACHKAKLLEYNGAQKSVEISPLGIDRVERELLSK